LRSRMIHTNVRENAYTICRSRRCRAKKKGGREGGREGRGRGEGETEGFAVTPATVTVTV
jgi:hypothetical protein